MEPLERIALALEALVVLKSPVYKECITCATEGTRACLNCMRGVIAGEAPLYSPAPQGEQKEYLPDCSDCIHNVTEPPLRCTLCRIGVGNGALSLKEIVL